MVLSNKRIDAIKRKANNIINYSRCNNPFDIAALYDIDVQFIDDGIHAYSNSQTGIITGTWIQN